MENLSGLRRCKKCLIREMTDMEAAFRTVKDYIDNLDSEVRTPEVLYEERLSICTQCEMLLEGTCRSCGCFVEMRAAAKKNACPRKKW